VVEFCEPKIWIGKTGAAALSRDKKMEKIDSAKASSRQPQKEVGGGPLGILPADNWSTLLIRREPGTQFSQVIA
jgi:hypothetical protein